MKKNKFNLLLTGLLSLAMVGCSSETEDVINPGGVDGETKTMTISFPNLKSEGTSYATATTAENDITSGVKVFVVSGSTIEQIADATVSGATATIKVTGTGTKDFYVAANTGSLLNGITTSSTLAQLLAINSTASTAQIGTPLLMDAIVTETLGNNFDAPMKRRVARFDIINNTGTNITKAYITKAKTSTPVFRTGTTAALEGNSEFNITVADGATLEPAFYLNPTTMGANTEIAFLGGDGKMYTVVSSAAIEANMRYIITLKPTAEGESIITPSPEDWGNGSGLTGGEIAGTLSATLSGGGSFDATTNVLNMKSATAGATLTVETGTSSNQGASYATTGGITVSSGNVATTPSYAAASYKQTHTVTVPQSGSGTQTVTFTNKSNGEKIGTITVEYDGEGGGETPIVTNNPLSKFAHQNLSAANTFVNSGTAYSSASDYGKTDAYGAWFQWGRKAAITNPSQNTVTAPVAYNDGSVATQTTGAFYGGDGVTTWHTDAGLSADIWTNILGKGTIDSDPCPSGYRVPTVDEWLAVIPSYSSVGIYESSNVALAGERSGENQITISTGPAIYTASGAGKVLYGAKKLGTEEAYALRWSYKGTGAAFSDQMTTTGGDTYLEIVCIPLDASFTGVDGSNKPDVSKFTVLDWSTNAEVRFLPAAGECNYITGLSANRGILGTYWSSSVNSPNSGWFVRIGNGNVYLTANNRSAGQSIRCVVAE